MHWKITVNNVCPICNNNNAEDHFHTFRDCIGELGVFGSGSYNLYSEFFRSYGLKEVTYVET